MIIGASTCTQTRESTMSGFDLALSQSSFLIYLDSQFLLSSVMAGSMATKFVAATLLVRNQPPLPLPENTVDAKTVVSLHSDLVHASQLSRYVEANRIETSVPFLIMQPGDLP